MSDGVIDFDPPSAMNDAGQEDFTRAVSKIASLNARAVMPDGSTLGRGEILERLGLNPDTSPTAWLNIAGCGSNASALLPGDLQTIAVSRLSNASAVLTRVQDMAAGAEGFTAGGSAPG